MFTHSTQLLTKSGWVGVEDLREEMQVLQAWPVSSSRTCELDWTHPRIRGVQTGELPLIRTETDSFTVEAPEAAKFCAVRGDKLATPLASELSSCGLVFGAGALRAGQELSATELGVLRVAMAVQADGHYLEPGGIDLRFEKTRKVERLTALMKAVKMSFKSFPKDPKDRYKFIIPPPQAVRTKKYLTADKKLKWDLLEYNAEVRAVVLEEIVHWDSSVEAGGFRFSTKHPWNADIVQAVACSMGRRARVSPDREWWRTRVADVAFHSTQRVKLTHVDPSRVSIFDISTSSGFLLCRQFGTVTIRAGF